MDVGHQAKGKALLSVIQEDGVLGGHGKHHAVRQLEEVGESLGRSVCKAEMSKNTQKKNEHRKCFLINGSHLLPFWS